MRKTIVCLVWLSLFLGTIFAAQAAEPVKIVVDSANPPFMYAKEDKAAGLYPVLLNAIFTRMGMATEIEAYPWKRTLSMGEKGAAAIGGIYKNEERLKIYDYSDPIFSEKLLLYVNTNASFPFAGVSDLKGKKIGVILGWSYSDDFDNARKENLFTADDATADNTNFKKLTSNRLDCVVAIELAGQKVVAEENLQDKVVALETPLAINDTYIVFAKSLGKGELLQQFNATLKAMKEDGSYDKVIADFIAGN